jgi:hypothetical protein
MSTEHSMSLQSEVDEQNLIKQLIVTRNDLLDKIMILDQKIAMVLKGNKSIDSSNSVGRITYASVASITTQQPEPPRTTGSKRGRKPKGEMSLANHILLLVQGSSGGLDRSEIVHLLLKGGYQSGSKKFADVVASTLSSLKTKSRITVNENGKFVCKQ